MPHSSDRLTGWLTPKWITIGVALVASAVLASYDLRLGLAAGAVLGTFAVVWLILALRFGSLSGARSVRRSIVESAAAHTRNRRTAEARSGLGPKQRSDPAQRP
jgi:hypothetical protein